MGAVYRVRDERTGRELALKQLHVDDERQRPMLVTLFEREFYTLAELAHPLIIEVHDYGRDEHGGYYTMELLDGQDLDARGQLNWQQACALLRDVASSLAIVHSRRLVHRDVTPRNVRCTASGRAKLLDFGAMVPMGIARHAVGTPPFVPPEAMQQQPLDGRSDLFSLGALAYFMLTGRYAYPARTMGALREAWLLAPAPPKRIVPELPRALSELVMELLQLDPNARPESAAVVIERLCAIAGLPIEERLEVSRAYLVTPKLVGRDVALAQVRACLAQQPASGQAGSSVLIEGPSGSGRSRFLDACVLEAKLAGSTVLRADASDGGQGDFGVARALVQQLNEGVELTRHAPREHERALSALLHGPLSRLVALPERNEIHRAVLAALLAVSRNLPNKAPPRSAGAVPPDAPPRSAGAVPLLVIAVDDLERVDEPSLRVLASLAHHVDRQRIVLLLTAEHELDSGELDSGARAEPAASGEVATLLRKHSQLIALAPLSAREIEALVRSLFGNTPHVVTTAGRIHQLSQGYPREALKLAQHLVERGVARHEAGGWLLPPELKPDDLPRSLTDAMRTRLQLLSDDARELAQMLALSDPELFSLDEYPALIASVASQQPARAFRAIDELVRASVLVPLGSRYRFSQRGWAPLIAQALSTERRLELHARHADSGKHADNPRQKAHHLLESGQAEQAIALLLERRNDQRFELSPATLDLVTRALERGKQLGLPLRAQLELQAWIVSIASVVGDRAAFEAYAPSLLARLMQDGGLVDYAALDPSLPAPERLKRALIQLQARFEQSAESERGLPPVEAIQRLGRVCVDHVALAGVCSELALAERAPRLDPLVPLSPVLWTVQTMADGMRCFQQGRYRHARELYLQALARIEQDDRLGGMPATYHKSLRLGVLYLLGLIEAGFGIPSAPERLAALELEPGYRVNGLRAHMAFALNQGDIGEAREYERRADLMQLEDGPEQCFPLTSARLELAAYIASDDLMGVKHCVERLQAAADRYRSGGSFTTLARAQYRRLQGDHAGALRTLGELLAMPPLSQQTWHWVAYTHVQVLCGLERAAEAADIGLAYLQLALAQDITPSHRLIAVPTIEALALAGRCAEAIALADTYIAEIEAEQVRGLHRGALYEARAKAAIAAGDEPGFRSFAERCSTEYRIGRNPALVAKYERLMQFAERHGQTAVPAAPAAQDGSELLTALATMVR